MEKKAAKNLQIGDSVWFRDDLATVVGLNYFLPADLVTVTLEVPGTGPAHHLQNVVGKASHLYHYEGRHDLEDVQRERFAEIKYLRAIHLT